MPPVLEALNNRTARRARVKALPTSPARTEPRDTSGDETVDLGPDNLFQDLGFANSGERLLKATLVSRIRAVIADRRLTQAKAGAIMGLAQPKVSELVNGAASGFGAERLIMLLNKLGVSVYVGFHQEPDHTPGETTFGWDRDRDREDELQPGSRTGE